ncbi:MAG: hypothetical protein P0Y65_11280 [Candidatus Devosia phytovorans]|uniref:Uncharacterized protein n=1 Tax=Candidatus Devosia phytovorans TaxID=3121372 RepID=A0AAJ5VRC5_9HYPH|nr:hypothetical protein [Devosia sp.]WEK02791.1 MAG: hypothetical protein P0Y65_11280 [Devosia sp.]
MTAVKSGDGPDWIAIRRAYELSDDSIKQICTQFGVTKGQFENRCRKDRWLSRQLRNSDRKGSTFSRLFALLERQVAKLGNSTGETLSETETRQLTDLIRNFDKIASMEAAENKIEIVPPKRDMAEKREKLARRIDQYNRR